MKRKPVDILHAFLTNQFLILLVAILLVLLVIFLMDQGPPVHIGRRVFRLAIKLSSKMVTNVTFLPILLFN
jgi:hypothetical protein